MSESKTVASPLAGPSDTDVMCVLCTPGKAFRSVHVPRDDPRLREDDIDNDPCPILSILGLPYALVKVRNVPGSNQFATYLMVEPLTGFAPLSWQDDVGEVLLVNTDGRDTTVKHAQALWGYMYTLMNAYGEEDSGASVRNLLTRESFLKEVNECEPGLEWHFQN